MRTVLLAGLLLSVFVAHAQLSGKLLDTLGKPVSLATVTLANAGDSSLVKVRLTDSSGSFLFTGIGAGRYVLRASITGFDPWQSDVFVLTTGNLAFNAGEIHLHLSPQQLAAVVVQARKPVIAQVEGGLSVDVAQSPMTPGSTVLQVLQRMPGVTVDPRGNSIALNGKTGVVVMLDGKLLRLPLAEIITMLNSMPADNLDKIEILSSPPARYDAEGTAGIINIFTKKNKKPGTSGSVGAMLGYGKGGKASLNGNLYYHRKQTSLHGYYDFSYAKSYSYLFAAGTSLHPIIGPGDLPFQYNGEGKPKNNYHGAGFSIDQQLTTRLRIGASLDAYFSQNRSDNHNFGYYHTLDSTLTFDSHLNGLGKERYLHPNAYLEAGDGKENIFRVELDYLNLHSQNQIGVNSDFSDTLFAAVQRNVANSQIGVWVARIDFSRALSKRISLETGIKGTTTHSESVAGIDNWVNQHWVPVSAGTSNDIGNTESIGAAYLSARWTLDSLTNISAGGRYEYAHTGTSHSLNNQYALNRTMSNFFPSVFINRKISENSSLQLSYTSRIQRPSYSDLASYVNYNDPVSVNTGNPALLPTVTSQWRIAFTSGENLLGLSYSHDAHPIMGVQIMPGPTAGLVYLMPENADWQKNLNAEMMIPLKPFAWWTIQWGWFGGYHRYRISYLPELLEKGYWSYSASAVNSLKLSARNVFELSAYYYASSYSANSFNKANHQINLAFRHQFAGNRGSIQASVSDLTRGTAYRGKIGQLVKDAFNTNVQVTYRGESTFFPIVKLSYSYRFGGSTNHTTSKPGSSEEQKRL